MQCRIIVYTSYNMHAAIYLLSDKNAKNTNAQGCDIIFMVTLYSQVYVLRWHVLPYRASNVPLRLHVLTYTASNLPLQWQSQTQGRTCQVGSPREAPYARRDWLSAAPSPAHTDPGRWSHLLRTDWHYIQVVVKSCHLLNDTVFVRDGKIKI